MHTGSQYFQVCQDFQDSQDCRDLLVGSKWVLAARAARTARRAGLHVATRRMRGATSRGSMCASAGGHSQSPDLEDLHNLEIFTIFTILKICEP